MASNHRRRMEEASFGDCSGASAVEFSLILPVFIMILMAGIEFGMMIFTYNAAQNAARDVTRRIATGRLAPSGAASAAAEQLPAWAATWVASNASVTVAQSAPADPQTNLITVNIAIPAKITTPTQFLSWAYGGVTLKAKVTMQQEFTP